MVLIGTHSREPSGYLLGLLLTGSPSKVRRANVATLSSSETIFVDRQVKVQYHAQSVWKSDVMSKEESETIRFYYREGVDTDIAKLSRWRFFRLFRLSVRRSDGPSIPETSYQLSKAVMLGHGYPK